jgi:hypothetical protein
MKPLLLDTLFPIFEQAVPSTGSCVSGVGVGVGTGVGAGVGVGFFIATPLPQTNFLPDFVQVYVFFK